MLLTKIKPHIINKPEHKFETVLFLPEGEGRKGEGGLRTRGYFKHSYKLQEGAWWICDTEGNEVSTAPEEVQFKIHEYISEKKEKDSEITQLPLITVITVVFNGAKYLEETIESVINQTYPNVEYIIIDGGSTDGTLDIIKKYEDKIDYWVSEKDSGIYDAMNKGIRVATGEWINFMNAGDGFYNNDVLYSLFVINQNKISQMDVLYGDTVILYDILNLKIYQKSKEINEIFKGMIFCHQSCFVNLKSISYFDVTYGPSADFNMMFDIYMSGKNFFQINFPISKYRAFGYSDRKRLLTYIYYLRTIKRFRKKIKFSKLISIHLYFIFLIIWGQMKLILRNLLPEFIVIQYFMLKKFLSKRLLLRKSIKYNNYD